MPLPQEDYFTGEAPEQLPDDLDFGDAALDEEEADAVDTEADDTAAGDDDGDVDADADSDADADDGADQDADGGDEPGDESGEEQDDEQEQPPAKPKKGVAIPKARFDQALRKQRVAEQHAQELADELAELRRAHTEASQPKPLTGDEIKSKMAEANEALIGGDTARAAEIQAEIFAAMTPRVTPASAPVERDVVAEVEARIEFKSTLSELNTRFPELDDQSESFDEELSLEAVDLQQSYMRRGFSLAEATRKAAEGVAKLHDLTDRKAVEAPAPKTDPLAMRAKAEQGKKTADKIKKAVKAPPALVGKAAGSDDVAFDVYTASEEELLALPKAVLDRLLGNV